MEKIKELRSCAICGSADYDVMYYFPPDYYDHNKFITHSWDGGLSIDLQIVKCKSCNLIYQNPCINEAGLKYIYPESIIPDKLDYQQQISNHKFQHLIDIILRLYPDRERMKPTALDIGTRFGVLPELLSKKGFDPVGIEYNMKCVEAARASGFNCIEQGTIDDLAKVSTAKNIQQYNVVVLTDVIEHLLNPLNDMKTISGFQKSGDRIFIHTMNTDSIGHRIFKEDWYYIHSQHTFYFTKETLKMLFEKIGYDLELSFQIPAYKSLRILWQEIKKNRKHKTDRKSTAGYNGPKIWFADNRPQLYDLFTLVFKKR